MAETYPTTEHGGTTPWGLGKSGPGIRPGFSQTSANLPTAANQWPNYYSNVMRGRQDGPWETGGFYTVLDYSKTYVEVSALNEAPPEITALNINGIIYIGQGGDPVGGMQPSQSSPGEGNGFNYTTMGPINPVTPDQVKGYGGNGNNGSVMGPKTGAETQGSCVNGTGMSPVYYAGYSGYSNPTGT